MKSLLNYQELILFDTETTGLYPGINKIIELGVVKYTQIDGKFVLTDELDTLININEELPENIISLTGITNEMLRKDGVLPVVAAKEFVNRFLLGTFPKLFLAYNAPFDINFINAYLKEYGYSFPKNSHYLDVLTVYKDRATYPHRLFNAIDHYNLNELVENSHRAIDDCKATMAVLEAMSLELDDLNKYINLFGYNPKYPVSRKVEGVTYLPQYYNQRKKLYE